MIDVTRDIHSLTTFKRNSSGLIKQMKKSGRPLVLTVKGKAEAVLLDAAAYQEVAGQLDAVASVRRGLAQARKGAGRPADEVFEELEREDAIPVNDLPRHRHARSRERSPDSLSLCPQAGAGGGAGLDSAGTSSSKNSRASS